jgi:3-isopropylmalate/(R)-2-methylmalate dehydratase small subunit
LKATGQQESFINGYKKNNMLNGFDDIDYLKNIKEEIITFADQQFINSYKRNFTIYLIAN